MRLDTSGGVGQVKTDPLDVAATTENSRELRGDWLDRFRKEYQRLCDEGPAEEGDETLRREFSEILNPAELDSVRRRVGVILENVPQERYLVVRNTAEDSFIYLYPSIKYLRSHSDQTRDLALAKQHWETFFAIESFDGATLEVKVPFLCDLSTGECWRGRMAVPHRT